VLDNARGTAPAAAAQSGRFSLLTYNVAGLPELFSGSDPEVDIALISPLLNHYDIALVQEDFAYHSLLTSHAKHAYRSDTMHTSLALMPDGLNLFSRFSFGWMHRVRWTQCNGYLGAANDCLADKGFSFAEVTLAPGVTVDMYDLHAEAGRAAMDVEVRRANFAQLSEYMRVHSRQRAVVIAGDTNLKMSLPHDVETLAHFLEENGLTDTCRRLGCGEERIDRVFIRSSPELELAPLGWWTDRRFVDIHGEPLSDHSAIGVEVAWVQRSSADLVAGR
jgi:hypothetical protein